MGSAFRTSGTTVLGNQTSRVLVLRDMVRVTYGQPRYVIPANGEIKVTSLQHTFHRLFVYAIVEEASINVACANKAILTPVDTRLTIDSDQLAAYKRIVIISTEDGSGYKIGNMERR